MSLDKIFIYFENVQFTERKKQKKKNSLFIFLNYLFKHAVLYKTFPFFLIKVLSFFFKADIQITNF